MEKWENDTLTWRPARPGKCRQSSSPEKKANGRRNSPKVKRKKGKTRSGSPQSMDLYCQGIYSEKKCPRLNRYVRHQRHRRNPIKNILMSHPKIFICLHNSTARLIHEKNMELTANSNKCERWFHFQVASADYRKTFSLLRDLIAGSWRRKQFKAKWVSLSRVSFGSLVTRAPALKCARRQLCQVTFHSNGCDESKASDGPLKSFAAQHYTAPTRDFGCTTWKPPRWLDWRAGPTLNIRWLWRAINF